MKNIVINEQFSQSDIKPDTLIDQYVLLLEEDVKTSLARGHLQYSRCPGCGSGKSTKQFEKFSMAYYSCHDCGTMYVQSRPTDLNIQDFFQNSRSKVFWRERLSEASQKSRKAKIIKPRLDWVVDSAMEFYPKATHWADIHTSQPRYVEAMMASGFLKKTMVSPYFPVVSLDGVSVVSGALNQLNLDAPADLVTLFEVLDYTSDVPGLLDGVNRILRRGGLCFITAILSSGFDVSELGSNAKNIYPPDRLNVFSARGLQKLLQNRGFEILEFSTPGILDVDIVAKAVKENPGLSISPFVRDLVLHGSEDLKANFQAFLQENLLSSYARVLVRKGS